MIDLIWESIGIVVLYLLSNHTIKAWQKWQCPQDIGNNDPIYLCLLFKVSKRSLGMHGLPKLCKQTWQVCTSRFRSVNRVLTRCSIIIIIMSVSGYIPSTVAIHDCIVLLVGANVYAYCASKARSSFKRTVYSYLLKTSFVMANGHTPYPIMYATTAPTLCDEYLALYLVRWYAPCSQWIL